MPNWTNYLIYHMTDASNWASIGKYGLLSTSRLLDLAGVEGRERQRTERRQRLHGEFLPNGALIRDQRPLPPAALSQCLAGGLRPEDWYAELNRRVFFWLDPARLNRQRLACAARPQAVLIVDARALLGRYHEMIELTPFNTGNARRKAARRGRETFVPYCQWRKSGWSYETDALMTPARPLSHRPVELAMADAIADICDFVIDVARLKAGEVFRATA